MQTQVSHPKDPILPTDMDGFAEGFASLTELALDVRSSCNDATDGVWRQAGPGALGAYVQPVGLVADRFVGQTAA